MKHLAVATFLFCQLTLNAQNHSLKLLGKYQDYFGSNIEIRSDSTFTYYWHFDLGASWSKGTWSVKNDTVYLKTILLYDTLRYNNNDGKSVDSLVLSDEEKPKLMTSPNIIGMLSSGGQNRQPCPDKLFYQKDKLFDIGKDGKLITKKIRGFWSKKKWDPWYFKLPLK